MADDDDDMMREILGTDSENDGDEDWSHALVVPERAVNSVELELMERLHFAKMAARGEIAEIPFLESDDPAEVERVHAHQAIVERLHEPAAAMWRPLIEIAHALGPDGSEEGYEAACRARGLEPWPKS
ncbi:MAG TPA: hypothetical protein VL048_03800 [Xanthobacteraceae bacterium]|nr:hypothetical protein [Xanthobacteraceae bacterium]